MNAPFDWSPLWISLQVALCATAISCALGLPLGYLFARRRIRFRPLWEGMALLPLTLPPTVLGYYLLLLVGRNRFPGRFYHALFGGDLVFTWQGAALAASIVATPLILRAAQGAFATLDEEWFEMARSLGATEWQIFWMVALPLTRRGVAAGVGLAFARSLGDFGATLMIAGDIPGATRTMSLAVYNAVNSGDSQTALGFTLLLSAVSLAASIAASAGIERRSQTASSVP